MPTIPALERLSQEDDKMEAIIDYLKQQFCILFYYL